MYRFIVCSSSRFSFQQFKWKDEEMIDRQFLSIGSQGRNMVKIGVNDIIVCLNIVADIYYLGEINKHL